MKALTYVELDCDVYRITRFETARVGVTPNGWTSRWNPSTTLLGVTNALLPSGRGARLLKQTSNARALWSYDAAGSLKDCSAVAGIVLASVASATAPGIVLRGSGGSGTEQGYVLNVRETDIIEIVQLAAGVGSQLAFAPFDVQAGVLLWLRFDAINTSGGVLLRGKAWYGELSDEPETFTVFFEDTTAPFTAAGFCGIHEFNTTGDTSFGHFRARSVFGDIEETHRFAVPVAYLPKTIEAIPSVRTVSFQPATISLGESLGQRATITVAFGDHKSADLGELYANGSYWSRFKARKLFRRGQNVRIIFGLNGQQLADMDTRHYIAESFDGPDPQGGQFTLIAKDVLKLADDERAQAPRLTDGKLAGSIDADDTAATLDPAGIGNVQYPASGYVCIGGNEVCSFTRTGDNLTLVRAQLGSLPSSHSSGERMQLVLYYPGDDVADVIHDLLTTFTDVDPAWIPLADWQAETAANLSTIYTAPITEPTAVKKLLSELIEQAALALWWDDAAKLLRLQVLKEIATDADVFDESRIMEGSLTTKEQWDKRISQIWTFHSRRDPTKSIDDEDNYRQSLQRLDLERELEYGTPSISKIKARWIGTETSADRLNQVKLSRFRDPPRRFTFDLFRGTAVQAGGGYRLKWWGDVDEAGDRRENGAPIQITRLQIEPDKISVEAEEMLASGVVVLTKTVFLLQTGSLLSWTVPDDWNNSDNAIYCIGGGGGGRWGLGAGGKGGGGGAFSSIANLALTPASSVSYQVGIGGPTNTSGGDTWFNGANLAASSVGAKGGQAGTSSFTGGQGGQASAGVGAVKFSGGNAGNGSSGETNMGGGGAGGAAGQHGNGANGGSTFGGGGTGAGAGGGAADGGENGQDGSGHDGGAGGDNRFNFGGGVTGSPHGREGGGGRGGNRNDSNSGLGGAGEQTWTQTIAPIIAAGPGGGGGGGGSFNPGRNGGLYGGGGGGAGGGHPTAGTGGQGIIVISWTEA